MNSELLNKIADRIEKEPDRYHQNWWGVETVCGTAFCIGGWALYLEKPEHLAWIHGELLYTGEGSLGDAAQDLLKISDDVRFHLFPAMWLFAEDGLRAPESHEAVATLRSLADTGKFPAFLAIAAEFVE